MADEADMMKTILTSPDGGSSFIRRTPIEIVMGRLMRAPDHDAGAADAGEGDKGGAEEGAKEGEAAADDNGTILGGEADAGDRSADKEADADKGDAGDKADEPVVPEAYELTAPEGFELDADLVTEATPVFKDLGFTNEQANKLMPVAAKLADKLQTAGQQQIMAEVTAQRKAWAEEAQADKDIGGAKWRETTELSAKALDALGYPKGSPFRSFLTDSGLGNHPEMIRAMRKVGELVSEDGDFVRGDLGAQVKPSREQILYPDDAPQKGAN